jgi:hypothetical protein
MLFTVAALASPSPTPRFEQRRISDGIAISLNRSSPPYAALEDELMDKQERLPEAAASSPATRLEAGRESFVPVAARILVEAEAETRRRQDEAARAERQVADAQDEAVRIHRNLDRSMASLAARLPEAAAEGDLGQAIARAQLRAGPNALNTKGLSAAPGATEREVATGVASPHRRLRLAAMGMSREQALASLFAPIVAEGGPDLMRDFAIAAGASPSQGARVAAFVAKSQLASQSANPALARGAGGARALAPVQQRQPRGLESGAQAPSQVAALSQREPGTMAASLAASAPLEAIDLSALETKPQVAVSGSIEVTAGLAVGPRDRLAVYREDDGQAMEAGTVSFREGRYEILVASRSGRLVSELRSANGDTFGRGSIELSQLGPATARFRYDQVNLRLAPISTGFVGKVASAGSMADLASAALGRAARSASVEVDSTPLVSGTRFDGLFDIRGAVEGSSGIARLSKPGFWKTLEFVASGLEARPAMLANAAIESFLGVVAPGSREASARAESGLAWGRVRRGGQAMAGARVELLTAAEGVRPVYFDEGGRPDLSLKQTTSNGLYAFYPVLPGVQLVQAQAGGETSETVVFPAEAGAATRADVEIAFNRRIAMRVFDAFRTGAGLQARIASFGRERVTETSAAGSGLAQLSASDGLAFIDVDAGREYATTRLTSVRDRRAALAPMLRQAWLDELAGRLRISQAANSGAIVGFVQGSRPYRAHLGAGSGSGPETIVYFDQAGTPTGADFGSPGGGFAIFNAPEGMRTIALEPAQSERWAYQTMLVERNVVNVAAIWLR